MLSGKISKNISICQLLNILPRVLLSCKNMVKMSFFFFLSYFFPTRLYQRKLLSYKIIFLDTLCFFCLFFFVFFFVFFFFTYDIIFGHNVCNN